MWEALVFAELLEEVVRFTGGAGVFELLVELGHEKGRLVNPAVATSEAAIEKLNNRVGCKLLRLQQNAKLRVWLAYLARKNRFDILAIVLAGALVGYDTWSIDEPHVLNVLGTVDEAQGLRAETILASESLVVFRDTLKDLAHFEVVSAVLRSQLVTAELTARLDTVVVVDAGCIQRAPSASAFLDNVQHRIHEALHDSTGERSETAQSRMVWLHSTHLFPADCIPQNTKVMNGASFLSFS